MGVKLVSGSQDSSEQYSGEAGPRSVRSLGRALIRFIRALWVWLTTCLYDLSRQRVLAVSSPTNHLIWGDWEKGLDDIYQSRVYQQTASEHGEFQIRASSPNEPTLCSDAQVAALLSSVKHRLSETEKDSCPCIPFDDVHDELLPPPPQIFHGRTQELNRLVDLFALPPQLHRRQSGQVIVTLQPSAPGAGTSALALVLLHRPEIISAFGAHRIRLRLGQPSDTLPHAPRPVFSYSRILTALTLCPHRTLVVLDNDSAADDRDRDIYTPLFRWLVRMPHVSLLLAGPLPMPDSAIISLRGIRMQTIQVGPLALYDARALFRAIADLPACPGRVECEAEHIKHKGGRKGNEEEDEHAREDDEILVDVSLPGAPPSRALSLDCHRYPMCAWSYPSTFRRSAHPPDITSPATTMFTPWHPSITFPHSQSDLLKEDDDDEEEANTVLVDVSLPTAVAATTITSLRLASETRESHTPSSHSDAPTGYPPPSLSLYTTCPSTTTFIPCSPSHPSITCTFTHSSQSLSHSHSHRRKFHAQALDPISISMQHQIDALLLHHAQLLPERIVRLAQRAQYEPLGFLLASCVEEAQAQAQAP
ncbi:hypothetical protein R3P38DRAFT_1368725 [Favolaschia claudopus]|uniref:Uncharacterized protein n=1 Tax=Favolaschia claudopus TaxID=2862362 RepID=A0AAW0DXC6_9AGAR